MKKKFLNYREAVQERAESNPRFSNFGGNVGDSVGTMNPLNRILTAKVVNASNASGTYVIFGGAVYPAGASGTSNPDLPTQSSYVTVTITQSSHDQVKQDSIGSPFYVSGAKIKVSDVDQFNNNIKYYEATDGGSVTYRTMTPDDWDNPVNQNPKLLIATADVFSFPISGINFLSGTIDAGVTLTITMTTSGRINQASMFNNKPVLNVSTAPPSNGQLPTIIQTAQSGGVANSIPMIQSGAVIAPKPMAGA